MSNQNQQTLTPNQIKTLLFNSCLENKKLDEQTFKKYFTIVFYYCEEFKKLTSPVQHKELIKTLIIKSKNDRLIAALIERYSKDKTFFDKDTVKQLLDQVSIHFYQATAYLSPEINALFLTDIKTMIINKRNTGKLSF